MSAKKQSNNKVKTQQKSGQKPISAIDKNQLKIVLANAVLESQKKRSELWLFEIQKHDDMIKEAYFAGAAKLKILKGLHSIGFKMPHKVFQAYFEKQVSPVNKRTVKSKESVPDSKLKPKSSPEKPSNTNKNTAPPGSRRKKRQGGFRVAGDDL
jgi:hypothetical protein